MRSVYGRTIFTMAIFILILFVVLGSVYFALANAANRTQQAESLLRSTIEITGLVSNGMSRDRRQIEDANVPGYITFTARSMNSYVWVVNADGDIIYHTGILALAYEKLPKHGPDDIVILPDEFQNKSQHAYCRPASTLKLASVLPTDSSWLVASAPIASSTGAYAGEVLLIQSTVPASWGAFMHTYAVPISFFIAFLIALVIIILLSKRITRPIADLTRTADRVVRGDLSARAGRTKSGAVPSLDDGSEGDLDDLTLLIKTFNTLIERMEVREKERLDFMTSISHDLRTPLTSLKGFVGGMLDGTIPKERFEHYLSIVNQEAGRLQDLVNTLFTVVLSEDRARLSVENIDLDRLIADALDGLEPQLRAARLRVAKKLTASDRGECLVSVDASAILRVLTNILINAIRFSPPGGSIMIRTKRSFDEITVSIEDEGPGILPEDQSKVFEQFYKVDRSRRSEGSGLGLYIAKNLLALHGQRIEAGVSTLGGARISFTLAAAPLTERQFAAGHGLHQVE
jgi:signal transduction histidine kinase